MTALLALLASIGAARSAGAAACKDAMDCSLNGDCISGSCRCDAAWSGSDSCDVLAFEKTPALNSTGYMNSSGHSWGGNAIEVNGTWHLFVAQMVNNCQLGQW